MWSRRFTDAIRRGAGLKALALTLVLAACASGPRPDRAAGDAEGGPPPPPPAVQTRYEQAVAAMAAGDNVEAELRFEEFLLNYPDYPGAHVNMAILKSQGGDDAAAESHIEAALALDRAYAPALNQLGMLRRRQGRFEEAENAYLGAVAADPSYALPHYNLGVLYELYLQRLEPALRHFEDYQALSGEDEQVGKWIVDLKRRIAANQRTANVTE